MSSNLVGDVITLTLAGIRPFLFANGQSADPLGPYWEKIQVLRSKRKKTRADYEALEDLMWYSQLYINAKGQLIVPAMNVYESIRKGASKFRMGEAFKSGLFVETDDEGSEGFVIEYEGPKDPKKMRADPCFTFRRMTPTSTGQRTPVVYPMISGWKLRVKINTDPSVLNPKDVIRACVLAGRYVAIGGHRPQFGRYLCEDVMVNGEPVAMDDAATPEQPKSQPKSKK